MKMTPPPMAALGKTKPFIVPETLVSDTDPLAGHTTYRLIAKTKTDYITTIYGARCLASCVFHTNAHSTHSWRLLFAALYGDNANPMTLPAAYHVDAPFGVNIGGVNPAFFSINPDVQYDSWLTVGITGGNVHNSISSIGIDWDAWTETRASFTDDGVCRAGFLPASAVEPAGSASLTDGPLGCRRCSGWTPRSGQNSQTRPLSGPLAGRLKALILAFSRVNRLYSTILVYRFVWAWRPLNGQKLRFPARTV